MIIEGLVAASVVKFFYSANKSLEIDEKALKRYAEAFEKSEEARILIRKKAEYTDKRLGNVAKKKRAIVQNTVPRFVKVYGQIQRIDLENKVSVNEIAIQQSANKLVAINSISISVKKDFTDKELVCGWITKGLGKLMEMDSERYLSAANNQMRQANVVYSQAQSVGEIYDAIVARADRIANLLMTMNALFIKSIEETEKVINKNGLNVRNYNDFDIGVLMTCVNMAAAMSDVIDVPVVDEEGIICESGIEMIETGEKYISKMKQLI